MSVATTLVGVVTADFESFYLVEYPKVYRACLAFTRSTDIAAESTQEAFARAFARWRRLSRESWAGGWVMTTAINLCKKTDVPLELKAEVVTAEPAGERIDLLNAMRALPHRQRLAAVLYYVGDMPIDEVAEIMGISAGAVKSHLARARETLRERLAIR